MRYSVFIMSDEFNISKTTTVEDLIKSNSKAVRFFLDRHLACAGCGFARFCTLETVSKTYKLDESHFIEDVQKLVASSNLIWSA